MRPATLLRAAHARQPMIHFLGKRSNADKTPHTPRPHPQAPKEIAESFQSFLSKLQSSSSGTSTSKPQSVQSTSSSSSSGGKDVSKGSGKPVDYEVFYEAPSRLWKTKPLEEFEMEAIMSGGATNVSA
ncbi:hypothetical protein QFC22_002818 [Naganishia vaughanmartiniae]|uniref:Uncharacterized protein n=1 Tax=Naganishia vaughanmartiniae TaxID=1424756 RepID=A0ACC2XAS4_9TREE|nr:hypothetical protein QFC22_002818 [Naganishia vaughanmartiniae]